MDGVYTVASLAMRYWFIVAAAVVLLGVTGISVKEYRDKRYVLSVADLSIGYFHVVSGPEDIIDTNIQLMRDNTIGRSKKVDISFQEPSIIKVHSQVYSAFDGRVYISRMGKGSVTVNGKEVSSICEVGDKDLITLGNLVFRLYLKEVDDGT
jgi:hypothetical protein